MNIPFSQQQDVRRGILLMLLSVTLFACMDTVSKVLTANYPVIQIIAIRNLVQVSILLAIFAPKLRLQLLRSRRPLLQFARSAALAGGSSTFVLALSMMPIAEAAAISFSTPLLVALLAAKWLGERSGRAANVAVLIGFGGVLIVMRPGAGIFSWAALLPLATAGFSAVYQVLTRKLSGEDHSMALLFHPALLATFLFGCLTPLVWVTPKWTDAPLMLATGALGTVGHFLIIRAFRRAPASQLVPFTYAQLVITTGLGYLVFGQLPDSWSITGMLVIVVSGLYVISRHGGLRRS